MNKCNSSNCNGELKLNDRYLLIKILGQNIGVTYLATDLNSNQKVVIKELSIKNMSSWKDSELFKREYKILSLINHPQIPNFIDYFEKHIGNSIKFYTVMEHIEGENLSTLTQPFTDDELVDFIEEVGEILNYLHNLNPPVIHRDIKPSNIIRRRADNKIVLIDFDSIVDSSEENSTIVGTFGYMAPEQFAGKANVTSDYYSLGVTALVLRTKREPETFIDDGINLNLNKATLSTRVRDILNSMIRFDSKDRVSNFKELRTILNQNVENIFLEIDLAESVIEYNNTLDLIDTNKELSTLENLTEKEIVFLEIAINNKKITLDRKYINSFYDLYNKRLENQDLNLNILLQYGNFYKNSKIFNDLLELYDNIIDNSTLFTIIMEFLEKSNLNYNDISNIERILKSFDSDDSDDIKEFRKMVSYLQKYFLFLKKNRKDILNILKLSTKNISYHLELEKILENLESITDNETILFYFGSLLSIFLKDNSNNINISDIISSLTEDKKIKSLIEELKVSDIDKRIDIFNEIFKLIKKLERKTKEENIKQLTIDIKENLEAAKLKKELETFKKEFKRMKSFINRIKDQKRERHIIDSARKINKKLINMLDIPGAGVFQLLFYVASPFFIIWFLASHSIIAFLSFFIGVVLHIPAIILLFENKLDLSHSNIDKELFIFVAYHLERYDLIDLFPSLTRDKNDHYKSLLAKIEE